MSMFLKIIHLLYCHVGEFAQESPVESDGSRERFYRVMARFKPSGKKLDAEKTEDHY